MRMIKGVPTYRLSVDITKEQHKLLRKISLDRDVSIREIIEQYLEYLSALPSRERKLLNGQSDSNFDIIAR